MRGTAVWLAGWGVASGVWRGEDAGHSDQPKTAPQRGAGGLGNGKRGVARSGRPATAISR